MKNLLLSFLFLALVIRLDAQTSVEFENLEFKRTENFNLLYKQYTAQCKLSVSTNEYQKVFLDIGAGNTEVYASENRTFMVEAEIVVLAMNENNIHKVVREKMDLNIDVKDDLIRLTSIFRYEEKEPKIIGGFFSSPERKINLKVYLPSNQPVKIVDRTGDLYVNNVKNDLVINDASGAIEIDGLMGGLTLVDHSGEIKIMNLNPGTESIAEILIKDNSGGIYLDNVGGVTRIEDTSGDIEIGSLKGSLNIKDKSGRIVIKKIIGDSQIDDTSGEIRITEVDGNVTLTDNSGGILVADVTKNIYLKRDGSGFFLTENIQGKIYSN